ncbi:MAG TPA: DUF6364 family protein [Chitinophagaceae bacterium]|jgi:hypothetical protein
MLTKLTLNISKPVIEKAKRTARKKRTSISRLVEEYLKKISSEGEEESIVDYMIKNAPTKKTPYGAEKKILKEKLIKKYGS